MHFFTTVQYAPSLIDDSWTSSAEAAADVCMAPGRWVASELWGEGKKYIIKEIYGDYGEVSVKELHGNGVQRLVRLVVGVALFAFGMLTAIPLMAFAYTNEEIRLKHTIAYRNRYSMMGDFENTRLIVVDPSLERLNQLIEERQLLAKERQGCDPIFSPMLLCSICYLLYWLACCKSTK